MALSFRTCILPSLYNEAPCSVKGFSKMQEAFVRGERQGGAPVSKIVFDVERGVDRGGDQNWNKHRDQNGQGNGKRLFLDFFVNMLYNF